MWVGRFASTAQVLWEFRRPAYNTELRCISRSPFELTECGAWHWGIEARTMCLCSQCPHATPREVVVDEH